MLLCFQEKAKELEEAAKNKEQKEVGFISLIFVCSSSFIVGVMKEPLNAVL